MKKVVHLFCTLKSSNNLWIKVIFESKLILLPLAHAKNSFVLRRVHNSNQCNFLFFHLIIVGVNLAWNASWPVRCWKE